VKQIANTLKTLLDNPQIQMICDRTQDLNGLIQEVRDYWKLDLFTRKPGPALLSDGTFKGTDLDLATFVTALADRGAVINLPTYKGIRAATKREGERVIAKENRHGKVLGLWSNQDVFAFGIRVLDHNVVTSNPDGSESVGAPRNFTITNLKGEWYDGWQRIEFSPTAKENTFLQDKSLWTENQIVFKNFVHPNRWVSFYGQYYVITKILLDRLEEESKHLYTTIKALQEAGVKYPATGTGAKTEWPESQKVGEEEVVTVPAFQCEIDFPEFKGEYPRRGETVDSLVAMTDRRKSLIYHLMPELRFAARAVELAFYKYGIERNEVDATTIAGGKSTVPTLMDERLPTWIDAKWERDYTPKGKRNKWSRLVLFQPAPGKQGVALRYRIWEKKERVAAAPASPAYVS